MKIGHYVVEILSAVLLWAIILVWLPLPLFMMLVFGTVLIGVAFVAWRGFREHNRPPFCDLCLTPINPEGAAERNHRALSLVHAPSVFAFAYGLVVIAAAVIVVSNPRPATILGWSLLQLTLIYVLRANVVHNRLRPWCKDCRNGGLGKGHVNTPTPDGILA